MEEKTDKTQGQQNVVPKTSQAPDPGTQLSIAGAYCPPSNTPARFEHWSNIPAIDQFQLAYLALGIEPGSYISGKAKQEYKDWLQLIEASKEVGSFPPPIDPGKSPQKYRTTDVFEWLPTVGMKPPDDWHPISSTQVKSIAGADAGWSPKSGCSEIDLDRFFHVVDAGISLMEGDGGFIPTKVKQFIGEAVKHENAKIYPSCAPFGPNGVAESTIVKSVGNVGNPKDHPKFKEAVEEFRAMKSA